MVTMKDIRAISRQIAHEFHPLRIILFGSQAWGKPTEDSDVDLMVIVRERDPSIRLAAQIRCSLHVPFPVDILTNTPEEIEERLAIEDWFIEDIIHKGKVLYEAHDRRVGRQGRGRLRQHAARVSRPHQPQRK